MRTRSRIDDQQIEAVFWRVSLRVSLNVSFGEAGPRIGIVTTRRENY